MEKGKGVISSTRDGSFSSKDWDDSSTMDGKSTSFSSSRAPSSASYFDVPASSSKDNHTYELSDFNEDKARSGSPAGSPLSNKIAPDQNYGLLGWFQRRALSPMRDAAELRSRQIDKALQKDAVEQQKTIHVLALGAACSGKTVLLRALCNASESSQLSWDARRAFRPAFHANLITVMQTVIQQMEVYGLKFGKEIESKAQIIMNTSTNSRDKPDVEYPVQLYHAVKDVWTDADFQACHRRANEYNLETNLGYLISAMGRIWSADYVPSLEDMQHLYQRTVGIHPYNFQRDNLSVSFLELGVTSSERRKWIHYFEHCHQILFTVDVCSWHQLYPEEPSSNRFQEHIVLFDSVVKSPRFSRAAVHLIFTRMDKLPQALKRFPVRSAFPDIETDADGFANQDVYLEYITRRFEVLVNKDCDFYVFFVDLVHPDQSPAEKILAAIKDTVISRTSKYYCAVSGSTTGDSVPSSS